MANGYKTYQTILRSKVIKGHFRSKSDKIIKNQYLTLDSMDLTQTRSEWHMTLPQQAA